MLKVSFRSIASRARRLAIVDRRLAMSEVARKLNKATQFCGSAIVNLPTGGKKKRLKRRVARTEAKAASRNPHALAMTSTTNRYANPTVVVLTGIRRYATNVTIATPAKDTTNRSGR